MSADLERRLQDSVYEALRMVEGSDLADLDARKLRVAAGLADSLVMVLRELCDQSPGGTNSS